MVRLVLSVGVLTALGTLGASCVSLFELDGYAGAVGDLCAKLGVCYGNDFYPSCVEYSEPRLTDASSADRQAWLQAFADKNCLETCASARACLDMAPVCGPAGQACGQKEQCCGFLSGLAQCEEGGCCRPFGVPCSSNEDCCGGVACEADADSGESVCGGQACTLAGEPCEAAAECCTKVCDPDSGTCSEQICLPDGSPCDKASDCCHNFCDRGVVAAEDNAAGVCALPQCVPDGFLCPLETPEIECCSPFCVLNSYSMENVCSSGDCQPDFQPCVFDIECCSFFCDPLTSVCTLPCGTASQPCSMGCCPDAACNQNTQTCCMQETAFCLNNEDCCEGRCDPSLFVCKKNDCGALPGDPCDPTNPESCCNGLCNSSFGYCCALQGCHSVCAAGEPLGNDANCQSSTVETACINTICGQMGFEHCCCDAWSPDCVLEVATACPNVLCSIPL
jgi:hypothetical protein